jgi:uncharacterized protein (TIGR02118 family)
MEARMVKIVALIRRKPELSRDEFLHFWQEEHPPYVQALPGIRKYVQNAAVDGYREWAYDGAAELWFDSVRAVAAAFDSPAAEPMGEHEEAFIGELTWFLADEVDVPIAPKPPIARA